MNKNHIQGHVSSSLQYALKYNDEIIAAMTFSKNRINVNSKKENEIELKDERNVLILQKAKAKSADITQWLIMLVAYLEILVNAPLWITLATIGIFVLYNIIQIYYVNKFNKEM